MDLWFLLDATQQGLVYGPLALAIYLSFRVLRFPDLTVDGSFPLGGAVAAVLVSSGWNAVLAIGAAMLAGFLAGAVTAWLHVRLHVLQILAGILTMNALYAINLRILGGPNLRLEKGLIQFGPTTLLLTVVAAKLALDFFLATEWGLATRATGSNPDMSRGLGVDTGRVMIVGLALANSLAALGGALGACLVWRSADVNMGTGAVALGLAAVLCGETIIPARTVLMATFACLIGSVGYQSVVAAALQSQWMFLKAQDLRLVTSVFVVALILLSRWAGDLRSKAKGVLWAGSNSLR